MKNRKVHLSTLWIFVTLNYIFCDILSQLLKFRANRWIYIIAGTNISYSYNNEFKTI